jgi:hypothetical protein
LAIRQWNTIGFTAIHAISTAYLFSSQNVGGNLGFKLTDQVQSQFIKDFPLAEDVNKYNYTSFFFINFNL